MPPSCSQALPVSPVPLHEQRLPLGGDLEQQLLQQPGRGVQESLQHLEGSVVVAGVALQHRHRCPLPLQDPAPQAPRHRLGHCDRGTLGILRTLGTALGHWGHWGQ